MERRIPRLSAWLGALLALVAAPAMAQSAAGVGASRESFEIAVPLAPAPTPVEGRRQLLYEAHLTNFAPDPLVVRRVRIADADTGATLAVLAGEALAQRLAAVPAVAGDATTVASGRRAIVFIELDLATGDRPRGLIHEITYATSDGAAFVVVGPRVPIDPRPPVVLGPPLAGGPWVAVHHPSWARGHRRVVYAVDGGARIPGRFAVDFVRVDPRGRTTRGDPYRAADALGHGDAVLAVADAVVVATRDDMTESPVISRNPKHRFGDATGNYVALALPGGQVGFYEHLKPGSVKVRPGDHVRRGQVIGALGFSGDTTGPHLHFHVASANSPVGAEGLPFAFDRFTLLGRYDDLGALGKQVWTPVAPDLDSARADEWPGSNVVLRFAD